MTEHDLGAFFEALYALLEQRKRTLPEGSYTAKLFSEGDDAILRKLSEETTEVLLAAKADSAVSDTDGGEASNDGCHAALVWEASDLLFHLLVLLVAHGVTLGEIQAELERRRTIPPRPGSGLAGD